VTNIKEHLRTISNEDGAAILDTESGDLSTLNTTGAYVWEALQRGVDEPTIIAALAQETGECLEIVAADIRAFLTRLKERTLLPR
jgi:hypothetical protein